MNKIHFHMHTVAIISIALIFAGCNKKTPVNSSDNKTNDNQVLPKSTGKSRWITDEGVEYNILAIGKMFLYPDKKRILTVKYLSKDMKNKTIRDKEFTDLYVLVGKNLKLDGFDYVSLIATNKSPTFGIQIRSEYRDIKPVEEVKKIVH
jgi:hypothetical protein